MKSPRGFLTFPVILSLLAILALAVAAGYWYMHKAPMVDTDIQARTSQKVPPVGEESLFVTPVPQAPTLCAPSAPLTFATSVSGGTTPLDVIFTATGLPHDGRSYYVDFGDGSQSEGPLSSSTFVPDKICSDAGSYTLQFSHTYTSPVNRAATLFEIGSPNKEIGSVVVRIYPLGKYQPVESLKRP